MQESNDALGHPERLAAIAASDLLDPGVIPALDRVVRTAARLLDVPVAQLNVVTADQQIPVSYVGADAWGRTVALERSYCQHAIRSAEPLVVEDAREHPLVSSSPATSGSGIVAYLSVPILSPRAAWFFTKPGQSSNFGTSRRGTSTVGSCLPGRRDGKIPHAERGAGSDPAPRFAVGPWLPVSGRSTGREPGPP